jgi:hypothetical protein
MNNKPGLSITQHKDLGKRLKRVRTELVDIGLLLAEAYPQRGPKAGILRAVNKAIMAITHIQQVAVDVMVLEHTAEADETIYF